LKFQHVLAANIYAQKQAKNQMSDVLQ